MPVYDTRVVEAGLNLNRKEFTLEKVIQRKTKNTLPMKTKPFSLDAYKPGVTKVVTRDGQDVQILITDLKQPNHKIGALIGEGQAYTMYTESGHYYTSKEEDEFDLRIVVTVREYWGVVIRQADSIGDDIVVTYNEDYDYNCFTSKEEAELYAANKYGEKFIKALLIHTEEV
jgi:hypothetical protein